MKFGFIALCAVLFTALQAPVLLASDLLADRAEADKYYQQQNFKKAFRGYYKLAKIGDHYSQGQVSEMYAKGEGKSVDLNKAYAWAVLAAEDGDDQLVSNSTRLLQQTIDKTEAQNTAEKLKKKYGKQALIAKADKKAERDNVPDCTGRRICRR